LFKELLLIKGIKDVLFLPVWLNKLIPFMVFGWFLEDIPTNWSPYMQML